MKLTFNGKAMEEIYNGLKSRNIEFTLTEEAIIVEGFSKSGNCKIVEDDKGVVTAYTRYNQEDILESFDDLVALNYEWFDSYRNREPFTSPSYLWAETLIEFGYLKKKVKTIVEYE